MQESFELVQEKVIDFCKKHNFDYELSGTTASIAFIKSDKIHIGHVGDSCIFVGRKLAKLSSIIQCNKLTVDHKPDNVEESSRISKQGGVIRQVNEKNPYRIYVKKQNYPGIAMSRSIGDSIAHSVGVTHECCYGEYDINKELDKFMILCSDGVTEFFKGQELCEIVWNFGKNKV